MDESAKPSRYRLYLFLLLAIIFIGSIAKIRSYDIWWHLAEGKYNLNNGVVTDQEVFSYTASGETRINAYWLFQLKLYFLSILGGLNLLIFFKALVILLSYFMLIKTINLGGKEKPAFYACVIILLLYLGTRNRFLVRPLFFMFFFLISYFYILLLYRESDRNFLPLLVAIQVIWGGTHPSVFYGQLMVGFFAAESLLKYFWQRNDEVLKAKHFQRFKTLTIYLALLVTTLLINPYSYKIYTTPLVTIKAIQEFKVISEWYPPSFEKSFPFHYLGVFLALSVLYFLVKNRRFAEIFILLFFAMSSFRYHRIIGIYLFMASAIVIREMREIPPGKWWRDLYKRKWIKSSLNLILACVLITSIYANFFHSQVQLGLNLKPEIYPVKAIQFIQEHFPEKRGLTSYNWGGFFMWHLFPDQKIFVDGRGLPFLKVFREHYYLFTSPKNFQKTTDKYQIDYVFFHSLFPKAAAEKDQKFFPPKKWRLIYWDSIGALYLKNTQANQPLIEQFGYQYLRPFYSEHNYFPAQPNKQIDAEIERAISTDPKNPGPYLLKAFLAVSNRNFSQAEANYLKVLELKPDYAVAHYNLGQHYRLSNQLDKATEYYRQAAKLNHTSSLPYTYLGLTQIKMNNLPAAIGNLEQAIKLEKDNVLAVFALGLALRLNNSEEANQYLKKARNELPNLSPGKRKEIKALAKTYKLTL